MLVLAVCAGIVVGMALFHVLTMILGPAGIILVIIAAGTMFVVVWTLLMIAAERIFP
jgi:hypothetical protein